MLNSCLNILVIGLLSFACAIRVDWNTKKGPIVPAAPRTTIRPQPPYREPAPVWEDQHRDIPNPNPYIYVLPPPSRPRPASNNYLTAQNYNIESYYRQQQLKQQQSKQTNQPQPQFTNQIYKNNNNGQIVRLPEVNANKNSAAALSPKYTTSYGYKYFEVLPIRQKSSNTGKKDIASVDYFGVSDKLQGKYNTKTKKYKAHEKAKYQPVNYYPMVEFALPYEGPYIGNFDSVQSMRTQQLPLQAPAQPFEDPVNHTQSGLSMTAPALQQHFTTPKSKRGDKHNDNGVKDGSKKIQSQKPSFTPNSL